jgi:hypothetical protein
MMNGKKIFAVAIISGLVGACAQTVSNLAKLDDSATSITASCANTDTSLATIASDGGRGKFAPTLSAQASDGGRGGRIQILALASDGGRGGKRTATMTADNSCALYAVQIVGTCEGCTSVLVEAGDKAVAVAVDDKGAFSYNFETANAGDISLTPLSF